jgi:hypothetical protein
LEYVVPFPSAEALKRVDAVGVVVRKSEEVNDGLG